MKCFYTPAVAFVTLLILPALAFAQGTGVNSNGTNSQTAIPTAVPFLNITPDSRSGALGEAGVAITPDVNATYWNPSKLAFLQGDDDVSLSYSPWLRQLVPDISLSYLSYAHKLDDRNTLGFSLRYFNYGTIQLTDPFQNNQGSYYPNEFQLNSSFARKFGEDFSLGVTVGFIHSNLSNAYFATGANQQAKPGNAVDAGVSLYYTKPTQQFGKDAVFSFGTNISNIGSKISYSDNGQKYFLPANLKIGAANTINVDDYNQFTLALDFNKLLVPTQPGSTQSVPAGIFGSFSDAPGGFREELQEITISPGLEYWYDQLLALRAGYFYENPNKGGAHYVTLGFGFKYDIFGFDFSYLAATQANSPLANTLRFSLIANFGGTKNVNKR